MAKLRSYPGPGSGDSIAALKTLPDTCTFLDGFEAGLANWGIDNFGTATHALETSIVHTGSKSLKTVSGNGTFGDAVHFYQNTPVDIHTYGNVVKIGIWLKCTDGLEVAVDGGGGGPFDVLIDGDFFWKFSCNHLGVMVAGDAGEFATGLTVSGTDWTHFVLTVNRSTGAYVSLLAGANTYTFPGGVNGDADTEANLIDAVFRTSCGTIYWDDYCLHDG